MHYIAVHIHTKNRSGLHYSSLIHTARDEANIRVISSVLPVNRLARFQCNVMHYMRSNYPAMYYFSRDPYSSRASTTHFSINTRANSIVNISNHTCEYQHRRGTINPTQSILHYEKRVYRVDIRLHKHDGYVVQLQFGTTLCLEWQVL